MNIDNIKRELEDLYEKKDPTQEEIFNILVENGVLLADANDIRFVYEFQEIIRDLNQKQYLSGIHDKDKDKEKKRNFYNSIRITPPKKDLAPIQTTDPAHQIDNWTIRFYSRTKEFSEIKSNLQLTLESSKINSGHTNGEDWTKFGNVGNTFYCLYFQNRPVVIKDFLAPCKYYAEFPLREIDDLWISNDWISMTIETRPVYRGNGIAIFNYLTTSEGRKMLKNEMLKRNIATQWPTLEVKIPHSMEVIEWLDNMEL